MYIYDDFSDFLWCFLFAEILPNHATVSELPNLSVSKVCQVLSTNVTNFNQTTVCSHRHHWDIGVQGCTFASLIHARAIPSSSWGSAPRWQQAVYRVSNGLYHKQLYRKGAGVNYLWLYSEIPVQEGVVYVNFTFVDINTELRHNVSTSQRSNSEQERVKNLKLGQSTFCRPGGVPIKNCDIAIFLHFHVYIWRLLRFCVVFSFCGNLTKPCHSVRIA